MLLRLFRNCRLNSLLPWHLQRNRTEAEVYKHSPGAFIKQIIRERFLSDAAQTQGPATPACHCSRVMLPNK
jgi:hypothetical protein